MAATSGAACLLLSLPALAAPPETTPVPVEAPVPVLPPEPALPVAIDPAAPLATDPAAPLAPAPPLAGEALRIVEGPAPAPASDPTLVVPAPVVEPVATPCPVDMPRTIGKRPPVGTGLLVGGASLLAVASVMVVVATIGRNEAGLRPGLSLPIGLSAVPLVAVGVGSLISGMKANQKYTRWVADNGLDAPASGNGMIAAGVVLGTVGAISMGFAVDHNRRIDTPDLGDRMWTGMSGATLAAGVALMGGGVIQRSRFAAWEGMGYVRPGFYAGRGGAGLTISGRF